MAGADEADTEAEAEEKVAAKLRETVRELVGGAVNPWCAICDADMTTWRYELRRTRFATMAEAAPVLAQEAAKNAATNRLLGDLHKTRPN
jgi:hypothetical protein